MLRWSILLDLKTIVTTTTKIRCSSRVQTVKDVRDAEEVRSLRNMDDEYIREEGRGRFKKAVAVEGAQGAVQPWTGQVLRYLNKTESRFQEEAQLLDNTLFLLRVVSVVACLGHQW